jgi:hypothetical protein
MDNGKKGAKSKKEVRVVEGISNGRGKREKMLAKGKGKNSPGRLGCL